jgi:D-glycero-D-manno-heptose 1,7-bisphosphate phosphatase
MTGPARALFLDRDGVINEDRGYVHRREDFVFLDGVFDACRRAAGLGYRLVVVTNQSGIGRGVYAEKDFRQLNEWMLAQFARRGVAIGGVYHDSTHPQCGLGEYRRVSAGRKPGPGMIFRARDELDLDLSRSALVGDRESDIAAARAAGVGTAILVEAGPKRRMKTGADQAVGSLGDAVAWLAAREDPSPSSRET